MDVDELSTPPRGMHAPEEERNLGWGGVRLCRHADGRAPKNPSFTLIINTNTDAHDLYTLNPATCLERVVEGDPVEQRADEDLEQRKHCVHAPEYVCGGCGSKKRRRDLNPKPTREARLLGFEPPFSRPAVTYQYVSQSSSSSLRGDLIASIE